MVGMLAPTKVQPLHEVSFAQGSPPPSVGAALELSGTVVGLVCASSSGEPESARTPHADAQLLHPSKLAAQPAQVVVHA